MLRVGLHENISILFLLAIKTAGSAQKLRVGLVSGNTAIFCLSLMLHFSKFCTCLYAYFKTQWRLQTSILTCIRPDSDALKNSFFPGPQNYSGLEKYPFSSGLIQDHFRNLRFLFKNRPISRQLF